MPYATFPQNTWSLVRWHLVISILVAILSPIARDVVEARLVRLALHGACQASKQSIRLLELQCLSK
jgi:hypothetical protein